MACRLFDSLPDLRERILRAPHLLLGLNFDVAVAQAAGDPATARLAPPVRQALESLAGRKNVAVVVLSGRDRAELLERVGIPGLIYAGNHGLEISGPGFLFVESAAVDRSEEMKSLAANLAGKLKSVAGVAVENNGLSVSVHYRQADPARAEEVRQVVHATLANARYPFLLTSGDKVFEIHPRTYWDRGSALRWVRDQLERPDALVAYAGDTGDEDVFSAFPDGITIKIGNGAETSAHYLAEDPAQVQKFLEVLAASLPG